MAEYNVWWTRAGKLGVGKYSDSTHKITTFDSDDIGTGPYNLRVWFTKRDTQFTATLTATPNIPSQFHDALVARVMTQLYNKEAAKLAREGKIEAAQAMLALARINMGEWKKALLDGKKFANLGKDFTPLRSIPGAY